MSEPRATCPKGHTWIRRLKTENAYYCNACVKKYKGKPIMLNDPESPGVHYKGKPCDVIQNASIHVDVQNVYILPAQKRVGANGAVYISTHFAGKRIKAVIFEEE